tara:strand:- start:2024 stop:2371 length:348 start_codon:yes stop_codon:yes gene_type:complete
MSRFGKYLGYMKIELEGDVFEIKPTLRQKQELMAIQQKAGKSGMNQDQWSSMHKIFKDILRTSDPEATDEELEAFLMQHDIDFMMKLFQAFGWLKEGDVASLKDELKQKMLDGNN